MVWYWIANKPSQLRLRTVSKSDQTLTLIFTFLVFGTNSTRQADRHASRDGSKLLIRFIVSILFSVWYRSSCLPRKSTVYWCGQLKMAPRQVSSNDISVFLDLSPAFLPKRCLPVANLVAVAFPQNECRSTNLRIAVVSWILSVSSQKVLYF